MHILDDFFLQMRIFSANVIENMLLDFFFAIFRQIEAIYNREFFFVARTGTLYEHLPKLLPSDELFCKKMLVKEVLHYILSSYSRSFYFLLLIRPRWQSDSRSYK